MKSSSDGHRPQGNEPAYAMDVRALLELLPIRPAHLLIFATLFFVQVFEGITQLSLAYAASAIVVDLDLAPPALGLVFAVSVGAAAVGALMAGTIGDIVGPKRTTMIALLGLGLMTALASSVDSLPELIVLRALGGIFSGAALPNVIALGAQFAPLRYRATIVTFIVAGFPTGAMLTGVLMAAFFPPEAWRTIFLVIGFVALVLAPVLFAIVPESLPILLRRRDGDPRARRVLDRFYVPRSDQPIMWGDSLAKQRVPLLDLFGPGFRRTSLLLSAICIVHLIVVYFLSNWLPILLEQSGASSGRALNLTAFFNFGGIFGVLLMGRLIDLAGLRRVLTGLFITGSASLFSLALSGPASPIFMPVLAIAGMALVGGTGVLNALPSLLYPAAMRATGGGWAIGTGHLGSATGPLLGGYLLQVGWRADQALSLAAVLPLIALAMSAFLLIPRRFARTSAH